MHGFSSTLTSNLLKPNGWTLDVWWTSMTVHLRCISGTILSAGARSAASNFLAANASGSCAAGFIVRTGSLLLLIPYCQCALAGISDAPWLP